MNRALIYFAIILLLLPAFAAANTYELRKEYSGNVVDGMREIVFANTTLTLGVESVLKFQFEPKGQTYLYTLDKVQGSEATFLTPTPQLVTISQGSSKDFDSNGDSIPDLNIYVSKVYTTGATIYATPIREAETPSEPVQNATPSQPPENNTTPAEQNTTQPQIPENQSSEPENAVTTNRVAVWPFILIAVIAIIAIIAIILSKNKRRPKRRHPLRW